MRVVLALPLLCCRTGHLPDGSFVLRGGTVVGVGRADVVVRDGKIAEVGSDLHGDEEVDVRGRFIAPAFVDSHVHLAYLPRADEMADGGVAAAVDLAAPLDFSAADLPLNVLRSGPMITAVQGYPTTSWGSGGYGLQVADAAEGRTAVGLLADSGVDLIKVPVTDGPTLGDSALAAIVEEAHARGLKVAAHALGDEHAARAAAAGADILAHTPTEALSPATLEAWRGRTVISTLSAFGGSSATVANLAALRGAGVRVLYGTDFGNTSRAGIDGSEIALLMEAGLDGEAVLAAGTSAPAEFWGLEGGRIEVGQPASLLVLEDDPLSNPFTLASPKAVWIEGVAR